MTTEYSINKLRQILWLMYKKSIGTITCNENIELDNYWKAYREESEE
jgi:hypothetical protein